MATAAYFGGCAIGTGPEIDARAGLACVDDSPECISRRQTTLKRWSTTKSRLGQGSRRRRSLRLRRAAVRSSRPEMCSLNMGSMNFSLHPAARKIHEWRHDWEEALYRRQWDLIFRNTFRDIKRILKLLGEDCGTRFEFECYDVGHLYNLAHFMDEGLVKGPFFIQLILGILGGDGPDPENLRLHEIGRPTGCSATPIASPCSARAGTRCRCTHDGRGARRERSAWGWRTACTWPGSNWQKSCAGTGAQDPAHPGGAVAARSPRRRGGEGDARAQGAEDAVGF